MLPELVLDNENFEEIMEEARNRIVSLYPEWTDFNYHDPGMTLIEMFSWLKESQQFFMDQISGDSRERYLKLLGMSRTHKKPASALITVEAEEDVTVLRGTRLYAGHTCFQAVRRTRLIGGDIAKCFYAGEEGVKRLANRSQLSLGHGLNLAMFGTPPQAGDCFYVGFRRALPQGETLRLHLELREDEKTPRNPAEGELPFPLAVLDMQYFGEEGFRPVSGFRDRTKGAVASGFLDFALPGAMAETAVHGEKGCFVRLILREQSYDAAPVLHGLSVNVLELKQLEQLIECLELSGERGEDGQCRCFSDTILSLNGKNDLYVRQGEGWARLSRFTKDSDFDTGFSRFSFQSPEAEGEDPGKAEAVGVRIVSFLEEDGDRSVLAEGTGFPFQEYDLGDPDVDWNSFGIMVQSVRGGPWEYQSWERVETFSQSGPEDLHYTLDAARGVVRFGDCIRGAAPEGDIVIVSWSRTLGLRGNARAGAIDRFGGMEPGDIRVSSRDNCLGGLDEETLEECFLRARRKLSHPVTAVSDQDYERRVMETPGLMLESCRVISPREMRQIKTTVDETEINIVVKPGSDPRSRGLSAAYKNNILSWMEGCRLAGRRICLLSPQYIIFEIYADIALQPHFVGARERVNQAAAEYFAKIGSQFGAAVQYTDFYGALDILDCVSQVNSLTIDAKGSGVSRSKDGTIKLPPNGVVRLGEVRYLFSAGE